MPLPPLSSIRKLIPLLVLVAGCSKVPMLPGLSPHKIDIQQGNYVTQDMVDKLKPGMSKSQVRFALGTPLVVDPFHNDRWDYVYVLQRKGRVVEQRRMIVLFSDDKLLRIEGDVGPAVPASTAGVAAPAPGAVLSKPAPAAGAAGTPKPAATTDKPAP